MSTWQPSSADWDRVIEGQNPWQTLGKVPEEYAKSVERPLANVLWRLLDMSSLRRFQLILGPRRVGKTTVMYQTVQHLIADAGIEPERLWWLRLDHPLLIDQSLGHLLQEIQRVSGATTERPTFVFLDEITYSDKWSLWLKTAYDEQWPLRIVATSSAVSAMAVQGAESGVGRWEELYLAPYLFTEYLDLAGAREQLDGLPTGASLGESIDIALRSSAVAPSFADERRRFVLTGGFPELLTRRSSGDEASDLLRSQTILKSDAIERAIYKDIPQSASIQDPVKLERLLYVLAGQITGVFSPQNASSELGMTSRTVETYTSYLERAFLVFSVPNYSPAEETVQRRGRKIYFVDGAVRNAALLRGVAPLRDQGEMGLLTENLAAAHLVTLARQTGVRLYHWRRTQYEVDLLYDHPVHPVAFEIASSGSHTTRGLHKLVAKHNKFRGKCYLVYPDAPMQPATDSMPGSLPLDLLLLMIGGQTSRALEAIAAGERATDEESEVQLSLFDSL